ncbi:hypothetical protein GGI20_005261 [Coemansia sp. BCRC 34301]|nr:hypothetical protein GGI20_005261 [Coemansia sp. BCRC 34301]
MGNHMSFSVTKAEEIRVMLAFSAGQRLDPRQSGDLIMVMAISALYFLQLIAVAFMLWNRSYPPIKAKNPGLMACVFVSSVMWFTGDIQANGHAPLRNTPLENCKAFGVWVRVLLGVCGMSALIGLRSYGLHRVFCRGRAYRGLAFYVPFLIASALMLVYGIVLQILPADVTIRYSAPGDLCLYNDKYKASLYALLWVTWIAIAVLNWRTRGIKSSFNEAREILSACAIVFGVLTFMTVLSYTFARYPLRLGLRIVATSLDQFAAQAVWWLMMAVPLFKCLTDRQRYLKEWVFKLRTDGLHHAYHVEATLAENDTSGGNLSYVHPRNRKLFGQHPMTTLVPSKPPPGPDFFYGAGEKPVFPQMPSSPTTDMSKRASKGNSVHWERAMPVGSGNMRTWDRLASAVNGFGVPAFAAHPVPPIPVSPLSPVSAEAAAQPYVPILDSEENDEYSRRNGRQLL